MAAVLGRTEVGVRRFGKSVTVPDNPKACLMYYLDCMCTVLDLSDTENLSTLRNYSEYYNLSEDETHCLTALCILLSPEVLRGKVIFQDAAMCGDSSNEFYEISAVSRNLLVSDSIVIGGQRRTVSKIMFCKHEWLLTYWIDPMKHFLESDAAARSRSIEYNRQTSIDCDCCCTII